MMILLTIPPTVNHNIHKWVGYLTAADEVIHHYQMTTEWTLEHSQATSLCCQNNFLRLAKLKM